MSTKQSRSNTTVKYSLLLEISGLKPSGAPMQGTRSRLFLKAIPGVVSHCMYASTPQNNSQQLQFGRRRQRDVRHAESSAIRHRPSQVQTCSFMRPGPLLFCRIGARCGAAVHNEIIFKRGGFCGVPHITNSLTYTTCHCGKPLTQQVTDGTCELADQSSNGRCEAFTQPIRDDARRLYSRYSRR